MDVISRASVLFEQPYSARLVQIASMIKQAVGAHEVLVMRPLAEQSGQVDTVWSDSEADSGKSEMSMPHLGDSRILTQETVQALASTELNNKQLQIHYYQYGFPWSHGHIGDEEFQAFRLLQAIDSNQFIFVWIRKQDQLFTRHDRRVFEQFAKTIESMDKGLSQSADQKTVNFDGIHRDDRSKSLFSRLSPMEKKSCFCFKKA